jgi:DNA invertase Pin-like site-specific DNA recombinase
MKAAAYIRVSGLSQVDGTSLDVQRNQIETYCLLKKMELTHTYCDAAISGGKPIEQRPEGSRLMEAVRSGEINAIVVSKLDRGFRNTVDCLNTVDVLDKLGVSLHIIDLGGSSVDSQSPAGRFMLTVLAAASEMERGQIRVRCASGREKHRAEGKIIGGLPYGFRLGTDGKTLVEEPIEQEALLLIHGLKESGHSLREIATELNAQGYTTKKGGTWTHGHVQGVLRRAA